MKKKSTKQQLEKMCQSCVQGVFFVCSTPERCWEKYSQKKRTPSFPYVEPDNYNYEGGIK